MPPSIVSGELSNGICHYEHSRTLFENFKPQPVCSSNDEPMFEVNKSCTSDQMTTSYIAPISMITEIYRMVYPSVLTDNKRQFVSNFFHSLCTFLGTEQLTTMYHPQTHGQAEHFNKKNISRLLHYGAQHEGDWGIYVQPLKYTYFIQLHHATNLPPLSLLLSRQPPVNTMLGSSTTLSTDTTGATYPHYYEQNCYIA